MKTVNATHSGYVTMILKDGKYHVTVSSGTNTTTYILDESFVATCTFVTAGAALGKVKTNEPVSTNTVYAVHGGNVTVVQTGDTWQVTVTHSNGTQTVYSDLNNVFVTNCSTVNEGDPIGSVDVVNVPDVSYTGIMSVYGGGDMTQDRFFSLVNDEEEPGAHKFYGTNEEGAKGWHGFPNQGDFIWNQYDAAQTPGNFWISGKGAANQFITKDYGYAYDPAFFLDAGGSVTGLFNPGINHLGFSTTAQERMRIDPQGKVTINTPAVLGHEYLYVKGAIRATNDQILTGGGAGFIGVTNYTVNTATNSTMVGGAFLGTAVYASFYRFDDATFLNNTKIYTSSYTYMGLDASANAANSTITVQQAAGIRTVSAHLVQVHLPLLPISYTTTTSHVAGLQLLAPYATPGTGARMRITNYYGLLLNASDEYSGTTITNRYGIYQTGINDSNIFFGDMRFAKYPSTRNDGSTLSALYVDSLGNLKHGPVNLGNAGENNGSFIWNQNAAAQTTSNFWIDGTAKFATHNGYEIEFTGTNGANIYAPTADIYVLAGAGKSLNLGANGYNSQVELKAGRTHIGGAGVFDKVIISPFANEYTLDVAGTGYFGGRVIIGANSLSTYGDLGRGLQVGYGVTIFTGGDSYGAVGIDVRGSGGSILRVLGDQSVEFGSIYSMSTGGSGTGYRYISAGTGMYLNPWGGNVYVGHTNATATGTQLLQVNGRGRFESATAGDYIQVGSAEANFNYIILGSATGFGSYISSAGAVGGLYNDSLTFSTDRSKINFSYSGGTFTMGYFQISDGTLNLNYVPNATVDPDKILVSDGGKVKYMTKSQLGIGLAIPANEIVYGTGTGVTSNSRFTWAAEHIRVANTVSGGFVSELIGNQLTWMEHDYANSNKYLFVFRQYNTGGYFFDTSTNLLAAKSTLTNGVQIDPNGLTVKTGTLQANANSRLVGDVVIGARPEIGGVNGATFIVRSYPTGDTPWVYIGGSNLSSGPAILIDTSGSNYGGSVKWSGNGTYTPYLAFDVSLSNNNSGSQSDLIAYQANVNLPDGRYAAGNWHSGFFAKGFNSIVRGARNVHAVAFFANAQIDTTVHTNYGGAAFSFYGEAGLIYNADIPNITTDPDKILVVSGGVIHYMTKAQLGIGGGGGGAWTDITSKPNSGEFIYNQIAGAQPAANFWIDGDGIANRFSVSGAGTITAPAIGLLNGGVAGFFQPATNTIGFVSNSLERMRLDANGKLSINRTAPLYYEQVSVAGMVYSSNTTLYSSGASNFMGHGTYLMNTTTHGGISNGAFTGSAMFSTTYNIDGTFSMAAGKIFTSHYTYLSLTATANAAASTVTMTQANGIRAVSAHLVQIHLPSLGAGYTTNVTHVAGMQLLAPFAQGAGPYMAMDNYYALLLNASDEYNGTSITNRWGIYQSGINDKNYFGGELYLNTVPLYTSGGTRVLVRNTASGRLEYSNISFGRFGVSGEDTTATENRTFNLGTAYLMQINGNQDASILFQVNNTALINGSAIRGIVSGSGNGVIGSSVSGSGLRGDTTSGSGVYGGASSGYGLQGNSTSGIGAMGQSGSNYGVRAYRNDTGTNNYVGVMSIMRFGGNPVVNGFGASLDWTLEDSTGSGYLSARVGSYWNNADNASKLGVIRQSVYDKTNENVIQDSLAVRWSTNDATPTLMNPILIPDESCGIIEVSMVARHTASTGMVVGKRTFSYVKDGGVLTFGTATINLPDEITGTLVGASYAISIGSNELNITVTGLVGVNINWKATVKIVPSY